MMDAHKEEEEEEKRKGCLAALGMLVLLMAWTATMLYAGMGRGAEGEREKAIGAGGRPLGRRSQDGREGVPLREVIGQP